MVFRVSLAAPAGEFGVFVTLTVSDPSVASLNTTNVIISGGETVSIRPRINGLSPGTVTITASATGYATVSQVVTVH